MVKTAAKKSVNTEVATPTPVPVPVPVVVTPPSKSASRSKKSSSESAPVATPTSHTPVVETATTKKSKKTKETVSETTVAAPVTQTGGKKSKKSATPVADVVVPVTEVVTTVGETQEASLGRNKRFFRCVYRATDGSVVNAGRYSGKKPKQAAAKALTAIVKKNNVTTGESVTFLIQECTRGSRKKKYSYEGSQVFLDSPVQITIKKKDGTSSSISYAKNNLLKKIALTECGNLVNVELGDDEQPQETEVKVQTSRTKNTENARVKRTTKTTKTTKKTTLEPAEPVESVQLVEPVEPVEPVKPTKSVKLTRQPKVKT